MRPQINRLPADTPKGLAGGAIDRARPVHFHLDGRLVTGYAGDTVLSAVLASGMDTLGTHLDQRIGLTHAASPAISHAALAADPQRALAMERTPALDGAEFVTLAGRQPWSWARLFQPGRSLGLNLDDPHTLERPWQAIDGTRQAARDVVIVGGGVAGLSAALTAARAGLAVALIEASPVLGGYSGLFGTQDGEDTPEAAMARLAGEVQANPAIAVHLASEVFSLRRGLVRAHRIVSADGTAQGSVIDIPADRIVLATGAGERLPLFAGNRLPGVSSALETYELASRYGIWFGRSLVLATASNAPYRLAILARDIGIAVETILDSRPHPNSRFIDFAKAYGIRQLTGALPVEVHANKAGSRLAIHADRGDPFATEHFVACGGWQPNLTLWHIAGGGSRWNPASHRIEPMGTLDGIALAGSAAGYLTRQGCIQSGADAIDALLGRERRPVADPIIDPLYETPDGTLDDEKERTTASITYLDAGSSLLTRPTPAPRRWRDAFRPTKIPELPALSEASQPLTLGTIAAGVTLGLIPPQSAGVVAQERVALIPLTHEALSESPAPALPATDDDIPDFLQDRFGPDARVETILPQDDRRLDPGALIFTDADVLEPLSAVGVVLRTTPKGIRALLDIDAIHGGRTLFVHDHGQWVPIGLFSQIAQPLPSETA